ncbi:MAG: DUF4010 domain-containing protein [Prevotellaceae bacterium]|jgi:uncharacterized membrane protein (DUF4010 family)|nr:DUF4010 domain-containing protein [Prevotellaceae bacterium]
MEHFLHIPDNYIQLFLVVTFSLIIGLSQRKLQLKSDENEPFFGSDRTFTLIGILGYILYIINPETKIFWGCGGAGLLILLGFNYYYKLYHLRRYGLTTIVIACITYCIPALIMTQPVEFSLLVLVVVLLLTEMKETFISVAGRMNNDEFLTLAKFIIIAGIILPVLPDEQIYEGINLTPRNAWLATVIISGMSYASYLLQKFVFRNSGLLVSGILGGLYSSTATTVVLSRKSKKSPDHFCNHYSGAIFVSIGMMFIRLAILLLIFNMSLFSLSWYFFLIMTVVSTTVGLLIYYRNPPAAEQLKQPENVKDDRNPLEFKVALIFAALFVLFTLIIHYTFKEFGDQGLKTLSFAVGITDITPFIINLFQGDYITSRTLIISATFIATLSNIIMQFVYSLALGTKAIRKPLLTGFAAIGVINILLLLIFL